MEWSHNTYECKDNQFFKFGLRNEIDNKKWDEIFKEDNTAAFLNEITSTLLMVNSYVTMIEIKCDAIEIDKRMALEEEEMFKNHLSIARELTSKLKYLAMLEKSSAAEKYEQSNMRRISFAPTEETVSAAEDTGSVHSKHGLLSVKNESIERRDSTLITLSHKYAQAFTSKYEIHDKLNHNVEHVVERFEFVLSKVNQKLQQVSVYSSNIEKKMAAVEQTDKENEMTEVVECNFENKRAVDVLREHLRNCSTNVILRHTNVVGIGHLLKHTYTCNISHLTVEGEGRKKGDAKENAATAMIHKLLKIQNNKEWPDQIPQFSENQLDQLAKLLEDKEDLTQILEESCLHAHQPPPLYTVISESDKNTKGHNIVKCEAMGFTAIGYGSKMSQTKKNAAKSILKLIKKLE